MDKLLSELSRRKVLRSLLLYAMVAWLVLQIADVTAEPLLLPAWVQRSVVIAAILGFPIVAILSWVFDLTRAGLVATEPGTADNRRSLGFLSLAFATVCLLGISVVLSWQWDTEVNVVNIADSIEPDVHSLAILPFAKSTESLQPHLLRLPDELAVRLSANAQLRLASADAMGVLAADAELASQAAQLGVRYLLGGTIDVSDAGVSLKAWLFDVAEGKEVWTREFANAQLYVVNDLVVNELLGYLQIQPPGNGLLTTNARAFDLYLRGLQSTVAGDDEAQALQLFQEALNEDPRFSLPHASLCRYYVNQYHSLSSVAAFENAERFCFRALTLDSDSLEVHEAMGEIYEASGQLQKARDSFNAALAINPEHFGAKLGLAHTYLDENPVYVESLLTELIRKNPGSPRTYSALQNLYFSQGRYADAVDPARWSLRLNPGSERAQFSLTSNLMLAGFFAEAKALLLQMLEDGSPRIGNIHSNLATVYFFEGDFAEAAALYQAALEREPESVVIARNLADAVWHMSGREQAQAQFENVVALAQRHLRINPDDATVLSCLFVAYASMNEPQQFEASLQAVLQLDAADSQIHYDAAVAYARLGNIELSSQHANTAVELGYPLALIQADPDLLGAGVSEAVEVL